MMDYVTLSLERAWHIVRREKSALWTAIYAYAMSELLEIFHDGVRQANVCGYM